MATCPNCNTTYEDNVPHCPNCNQSQKKQNKSLRRLCIAAAALAVMLSIAAGLGAFFSPIRAVYDHLESGQPQQALAVYQQEIEGHKLSRALLQPLLQRSARRAMDAYGKKETAYSVYLSQAQAICVMGGAKIHTEIHDHIESIVKQLCTDYMNGDTSLAIVRDAFDRAYEANIFSDGDTELALALNDLGWLDESRRSYEKAEIYYGQKNYAYAIPYYRDVLEIDANYNDAQKKILLCLDGYRTQLLDKASNIRNWSDIPDMIAQLERDRAELLPEDEVLSQRIAELKQEYARSIKSYALELAAMENYASMYGEYHNDFEVVLYQIQPTISLALQQNENDSELKAAWTKMSDYLLTEVTEIASQRLAAWDIAYLWDIMEPLSNQVDTNNALFRNVERIVMDYCVNQISRPYDDFSLELRSHNCDSFNDMVKPTAMDRFGFQYDPSRLLQLTSSGSDDIGYFTFYPGNEQRTLINLYLRGTISLSRDSSCTPCKVEIYLDNQLQYTSPDLSTTNGPAAVNIALTGFKSYPMPTLEIRLVPTKGNSDEVRVLLSDFRLLEDYSFK